MLNLLSNEKKNNNSSNRIVSRMYIGLPDC